MGSGRHVGRGHALAAPGDRATFARPAQAECISVGVVAGQAGGAASSSSASRRRCRHHRVAQLQRNEAAVVHGHLHGDRRARRRRRQTERLEAVQRDAERCAAMRMYRLHGRDALLARGLQSPACATTGRPRPFAPAAARGRRVAVGVPPKGRPMYRGSQNWHEFGDVVALGHRLAQRRGKSSRNHLCNQSRAQAHAVVGGAAQGIRGVQRSPKCRLGPPRRAPEITRPRGETERRRASSRRHPPESTFASSP